jgi:hypothetical protein
MNKFDKKITKLFDERFGETLTDELQKVRDKIAGASEETEETVIEPTNINEDTDLYNEEDDDDTEESDSNELGGDEEEEFDGDDTDSQETEDEGFDISTIYDEVKASFEDMSDTELEYEIHLVRQQLFDLEDQYGPNSDEFIEAFVKTRVAYQMLNSETISPDSDAFSPMWSV